MEEKLEKKSKFNLFITFIVCVIVAIGSFLLGVQYARRDNTNNIISCSYAVDNQAALMADDDINKSAFDFEDTHVYNYSLYNNYNSFDGLVPCTFSNIYIYCARSATAFSSTYTIRFSIRLGFYKYINDESTFIHLTNDYQDGDPVDPLNDYSNSNISSIPLLIASPTSSNGLLYSVNGLGTLVDSHYLCSLSYYNGISDTNVSIAGYSRPVRVYYGHWLTSDYLGLPFNVATNFGFSTTQIVNFVSYVDINGASLTFALGSDFDSYSNESNVVYSYDFTGTGDDYQNGYDYGYNTGYNNGDSIGYNRGYLSGVDVGYWRGYNAGLAEENDFSFLGLMGAAVDAPIKVISGLFDFSIFGVNMRNFLFSLASITLVIVIVRFVLARKE